MIKLNLKSHRTRNNLTQSQLAFKSQVSQTYISRLENNNFFWIGRIEANESFGTGK